MDRLERDFYSIETDASGNKCIHVWGYCYCNPESDDAERPYRNLEFCFCYLPIGLSEEEFDEAYCSAVENCKQYIEDCSEGEIIDIMDNYFGDEKPTELSYYEINADTPCGDYIA